MKKILVCDDDEVMLNLISFKFNNANLGQVVNATDGRQAKSLLNQFDFDLIITDIHMPFYSGLEITTYVRKEQKKSTPIIVLSGEGHENVVIQAFEIGANDFVTKPFNPLALILKAKNFLL